MPGYYLLLFFLVNLFIPVAQASVETGEQILEQVNTRINNINTAELQAILKKDPLTILIDVRSNKEIALRGGTIDAAYNINILRGWLEFRIQEYAASKDTPIIVYCGINERSPLAADTLMKMG